LRNLQIEPGLNLQPQSDRDAACQSPSHLFLINARAIKAEKGQSLCGLFG